MENTSLHDLHDGVVSIIIHRNNIVIIDRIKLCYQLSRGKCDSTCHYIITEPTEPIKFSMIMTIFRVYRSNMSSASENAYLPLRSFFNPSAAVNAVRNSLKDSHSTQQGTHTHRVLKKNR